MQVRRHFRDRERHGLTGEEFEVLAEAFGRMLLHVRSVRPFRPALVELFRDVIPTLAAKLDGLSDERFETLCERIKERARRSS